MPFYAKIVYIWLGRSDSNTRMTESESVALPLGDAPICENLRSFYLRYFIKLFLILQAFSYPFQNFFLFSAKKVLSPPFLFPVNHYDKEKKELAYVSLHPYK